MKKMFLSSKMRHEKNLETVYEAVNFWRKFVTLFENTVNYVKCYFDTKSSLFLFLVKNGFDKLGSALVTVNPNAEVLRKVTG